MNNNIRAYRLATSLIFSGLTLLLGYITLQSASAQRSSAIVLRVCGNPTICTYSTIQAAVNAASDGDVISLFVLTHTEQAIVIDKNITIQGINASNPTVIRGADPPASATDRIFLLNNNLSVTFQDVHITGGRNNPGGGAIRGDGGQLTIINSTFSDNESQLSGGAISFPRGDLIIENGTFYSNTTSGVGGAVAGGLIGSVSIENSSFTNNRSTAQQGGALHIGRFATASITNTTFENNTAFRHPSFTTYPNGGALFSDELSTVSLVDSTLRNNHADGDGGGIYSLGDLTIRNTQIVSNSAENGAAINHSSGELLRGATTRLLAINDSNIEHNAANSSAGGIYSNFGLVHLDNVAIFSNSAEFGGGMTTFGGTVTINRSTISSNHSNQSAGGIYIESAAQTATISGTTFFANSAGTNGCTRRGGLCPSGGALLLGFGSTAITNSTFTNNSATTEGGAVYAIGELQLRTVDFLSNSADSAGAVYHEGRLPVETRAAAMASVPPLRVVSSNFHWNTGGALVANSPLTVTSSVFQGNSNGGGGAIDTHQTALIDDTLFRFNTARDRGGAIYVRSSAVTTVSNSIFADNSVGESVRFGDVDQGGALYNEGQATLHGTSFIRNYSEEQGGSIYNDGVLRLIDSSVTSESTNQGGGIYNRSVLFVERSTLNGNSADNGAAIYNRDGAVNLVNSTLSGNSASANGGGIEANGGAITITHSTIVSNSANLGGGLAFHNNAQMRVRNTVVAYNSGNNCGLLGNHFWLEVASLDDDGSCFLGSIFTITQLAPLADNGGATLTHMPSATSPLLAAATNAFCASTGGVDQRGYTRPNNTCDIGAVERAGSIPTAITLLEVNSAEIRSPLPFILLLTLLTKRAISRRKWIKDPTGFVPRSSKTAVSKPVGSGLTFLRRF